jgi:hypothetical protein
LEGKIREEQIKVSSSRLGGEIIISDEEEDEDEDEEEVH